jgi:hypothetical protein
MITKKLLSNLPVWYNVSSFFILKVLKCSVYLKLLSKDGADMDSVHNKKAIIEHYLDTYPDIKVFRYDIEK